MSYFTEISVGLAQSKLINNEATLILDTRDAYSYKEGHIEGAMQAHSDLIEHLIRSKQHDRPLLIYCYQGNSSKDLAEILGRTGYKHCYSLKGGFTAWKKRDSLYSSTPYSTATNQWLVQNGFEEQSLNATIDHNTTPLILACQQGNQTVVEELIAAKADVDFQNTDGNTALWAACYSESTGIINALLEAGANINHQNTDGVSSLIYSASAGKTAIVDLLLDAGGDSELKTVDDFSAMDLAANKTILKRLQSQETA